MPEAMFNLGDAIYKQKRYDEAIKQFQSAAQTNPDPHVKAQAYHNIGNAYLEQARAYHGAGKSDSAQEKLQMRPLNHTKNRCGKINPQR